MNRSILSFRSNPATRASFLGSGPIPFVFLVRTSLLHERLSELAQLVGIESCHRATQLSVDRPEIAQTLRLIRKRAEAWPCCTGLQPLEYVQDNVRSSAQERCFILGARTPGHI